MSGVAGRRAVVDATNRTHAGPLRGTFGLRLRGSRCKIGSPKMSFEINGRLQVSQGISISTFCEVIGCALRLELWLGVPIWALLLLERSPAVEFASNRWSLTARWQSQGSCKKEISNRQSVV